MNFLHYLKLIFSFIADFSIKISHFISHVLKILQTNIASDSNMQTRIYSGAIFGGIFLISIFIGGFVFNSLMLILALIIYHEWIEIIQILKAKDYKKYQIWFLNGIAYTVIPVACLITINGLNYGSSIIFWYFSVIWATDCGAYFVGKKFGGKKLAPTVSPGKTIYGSIGGLISALIIGGLFSFSLLYTNLSNIGILGSGVVALFISILAQLSDLLESYIKRLFNIKDTGNIIPGHGGIMDRMDSITFSAPFLLFILVKIGG